MPKYLCNNFQGLFSVSFSFSFSFGFSFSIPIPLKLLAIESEFFKQFAF